MSNVRPGGHVVLLYGVCACVPHRTRPPMQTQENIPSILLRLLGEVQLPLLAAGLHTGAHTSTERIDTLPAATPP